MRRGALSSRGSRCVANTEMTVLLIIESSCITRAPTFPYVISEACEERLIREVMATDEVEWDQAKIKFDEISRKAGSGMGVLRAPYISGCTVVAGAGLLSFPLCFDLSTAMAFNDACVTANMEDPENLETILEVGSWTWGWMEPPLGQLSFFLLCLQFSRAQMAKIGMKPVTQNMINWRATRLANAFPEYHAETVKQYGIVRGLD